MEKKESKLLPLLSLIFGIASILTSCILFLSLPLAITSIILAIISFVKKKPVAMPIIGLICSFGGIIAVVIITLVGTTLNVALGSNGLFESAKEASEEFAQSSLQEIELMESIEETDYYINEIVNENTVTTNAENTIENVIEVTTENNVENTTSTEISDKWEDGEFILDGKKYKLFDKYSELELAGWTFDMSDYGYDDTYVLNSNQKTFSTIYLENEKYDSRVSFGLINTNSGVSTIKECAMWSFKVDNSYVDNPVSFTLAKGIKNGSTLEEVKTAYGEPDDTYYAESLGYWTYTYDNDYEPQLRLTIYEDISKGLTSFEYKHY